MEWSSLDGIIVPRVTDTPGHIINHKINRID